MSSIEFMFQLRNLLTASYLLNVTELNKYASNKNNIENARDMGHWTGWIWSQGIFQQSVKKFKQRMSS